MCTDRTSIQASKQFNHGWFSEGVAEHLKQMHNCIACISTANPMRFRSPQNAVETFVTPCGNPDCSPIKPRRKPIAKPWDLVASPLVAQLLPGPSARPCFHRTSSRRPSPPLCGFTEGSRVYTYNVATWLRNLGPFLGFLIWVLLFWGCRPRVS